MLEEQVEIRTADGTADGFHAVEDRGMPPEAIDRLEQALAAFVKLKGLFAENLGSAEVILWV